MSNSPDRWALITGASSGLGALFAHAYAKKSYNLVLTARRGDALRQLADKLSAAHGIRCHVETGDLSKPGAADTLKGALDAEGIAPDVLINNAGFGVYGPFLKADAAAIRQMLQVDITALTDLTHLFGQAMVKRGHGQILLVSSLLGYQATPGYAAYGAAKAYVLSFGEALHEELKGSGVTVTVLSPGLTDTDFIQTADQPVGGLLKQMIMQPEPVVAAGIAALERGRASVVPGLMNKLTAQTNRLSPRAMQRKIMQRVMRG